MHAQTLIALASWLVNVLSSALQATKHHLTHLCYRGSGRRDVLCYRGSGRRDVLCHRGSGRWDVLYYRGSGRREQTLSQLTPAIA